MWKRVKRRFHWAILDDYGPRKDQKSPATFYKHTEWPCWPADSHTTSCIPTNPDIFTAQCRTYKAYTSNIIFTALCQSIRDSTSNCTCFCKGNATNSTTNYEDFHQPGTAIHRSVRRSWFLLQTNSFTNKSSTTNTSQCQTRTNVYSLSFKTSATDWNLYTTYPVQSSNDTCTTAAIIPVVNTSSSSDPAVSATKCAKTWSITILAPIIEPKADTSSACPSISLADFTAQATWGKLVLFAFKENGLDLLAPGKSPNRKPSSVCRRPGEQSFTCRAMAPPKTWRSQGEAFGFLPFSEWVPL